MLTPNAKTNVIDADAHVVENERVWDYLEAGEEKYRPTLVAEPDNPERQHWVLDGEDLGPKFPSPNEKQSEEHVKRFGREVGTPVQARELSDVTQRLRHMDALGGSPHNMGRDVLRAKFRKMARAELTEERIDKVIEAVDRLETYEKAAELLPLLVK